MRFRPGYFQQLPSELLDVHLNVCHGLLRSTALRCGEARAQNDSSVFSVTSLVLTSQHVGWSIFAGEFL